MYILRLKYENGRVEYREYADFYCLDTIMSDISMDLNVYADLESVKVFKVMDRGELALERDLLIQAEQMQF